jgi:hypothetical protein
MVTQPCRLSRRRLEEIWVMVFRRLFVVGSAAALALGLLAGSMLVSVPVARAGAADADAKELVRLINGARHAAGKSSLNIDIYLASKARDGAIPCPDDAAKTISGRTKDFAATGHMSHNLRLCDSTTYAESTKTMVAQMQSWGYGAVGEILLVNGGYGNGKYKSWSTWTYSTTGHAMLGWAKSSSHWSIIMGSYDRVGCGSWAVGSTFYYACEFARGGPSPSGLAAPPTKSPFSDPLPTPKPTPVPTPKPTTAATPVRTSNPGSGSRTAPPAAHTSAPTATPTPSAVASETPGLLGAVSSPDASADASTGPEAEETSLVMASAIAASDASFDPGKAALMALAGLVVAVSLGGMLVLVWQHRPGKL